MKITIIVVNIRNTIVIYHKMRENAQSKKKKTTECNKVIARLLHQ